MAVDGANAESATDSLEDTSEENGVELSMLLSAVARLVLPVAILLLSANYVRVTWGRIRWSNLQYPYFLIAVMSAFVLWVIYDEISELSRMDKGRTTRAAFKDLVDEWQASILFAIIVVVYALAIPILGFFTASFIAMIAIMRSSGVRNYRISLLVTVGILGLIWLMFVEFVGITPPTGIVDELFV